MPPSEQRDQNVERARKLDTTALSDAMDRLGIAGQCLGIKPLDHGFRTAGRAFTILYGPAGKPLFTTTSWLGVPTLKCPLDTWVYQEILFKTRPEVIVETGVMFGGSSYYLASVCDLIGAGEIIACDITLAKVYPEVRRHPRIRLLEGSSVDPAIFAEIRRACVDSVGEEDP